jgi:hypothetical protein
MRYDEGWGRSLGERFPPRAPDAERRDWDEVRVNFSVGQAAIGVVVAWAHFGAWLDIGAGFPALLLIPDVAGLTPGRYQAGEWCPVGSTQGARIVLFNDDHHQIRVVQGIPLEGHAEPIAAHGPARDSGFE